MTKEVYISVDIESDGPIPGEFSMLSLGAAAFVVEQKDPVDQFSVNLCTLLDAGQDPDTMKWWGTQPAAWAACRKDREDPRDAMLNFVQWIKHIEKKMNARAVFIGYPAGFDFTFVYWYLIKFAGKSPFSFSALDMKTYAMCMLKKGYRQSTKKNMPKRWFSKQRHTHLALDDAIGQGQLFMNMLRENTGQESSSDEKWEQWKRLFKACPGLAEKILEENTK